MLPMILSASAGRRMSPLSGMMEERFGHCKTMPLRAMSR